MAGALNRGPGHYFRRDSCLPEGAGDVAAGDHGVVYEVGATDYHNVGKAELEELGGGVDHADGLAVFHVKEEVVELAACLSSFVGAAAPADCCGVGAGPGVVQSQGDLGLAFDLDEVEGSAETVCANCGHVGTALGSCDAFAAVPLLGFGDAFNAGGCSRGVGGAGGGLLARTGVGRGCGGRLAAVITIVRGPSATG